MSYSKKRKYDDNEDKKQFDKIYDIMSEKKNTEKDGEDIIENENLKSDLFV